MADSNIEKRRKQARDYQQRLRLKVLHALGRNCAECGFPDTRALQIDHKAGGGNRHIKSTPWARRYRQVLENPNSYQLLCANCNWIKRQKNRHENGGRPALS